MTTAMAQRGFIKNPRTPKHIGVKAGNRLFIGWSRHGEKGAVSKYILNNYSNAITSFAGGHGYKDPETTMGNTCPYVLMEYE